LEPFVQVAGGNGGWISLRYANYHCGPKILRCAAAAVFLPAGEALACRRFGGRGLGRTLSRGLRSGVGEAVGVFFFAALFACVKPAGTPNPAALSSRIRSAGRSFASCVSLGLLFYAFYRLLSIKPLFASIGLY
jgi:hypothetical protein